ncbi:sugar phosphate isomerase/epimerase [Yinghuangia sp. ASG 101]|uniref:sugar phosphate isomerase/epimerase family protein n=1 Tax=Yinghuangia sp. ASG 101 TaxID=2896848 RepID=UPI001E288C02|nr:sugar phosphate isomerase/epimerase family protein [Yinghuangia sp. ASG 101]UGQ11173.1 sugar phosphate isomerase/epimerase [Yinghuangia sp. ASG 101]
MHRLSLNQKTVDRWSLAEAVDGCVRAGITAIGIWREPLHDTGVTRGAKLIRDAGLRVSSLCRGGFFTAPDGPARVQALDDNRRAIDEAAALDAACLVLVVGGLPHGSRDLPGARLRVAEALNELAPYAQKSGVRLALEPMNPVYCADRGVLSTLGQALDLAEQFDPCVVGVVVDTFHVWWDPDVEVQIARAAGRIAGYQVCDWITPLPPDTLLARGVMGDGHIDFPRLGAAVDAAGYRGDTEVEIFNADLWARPGDETVELIKSRYAQHVAVTGGATP